MSSQPGSPQASPYAAPNTPIASSKRAKFSKKGETIRSPSLQPKSSSLSTSYNIDSPSDKSRKSSLATIIPTTGPTTKVLFSPLLRKDEDDNKLVENNQNTTPTNKGKTDNTDSNGSNEDDDEDEDAFNPYQFIAGLPTHESVVVQGKICLPPYLKSSKLPTLTLDLDETLVHCTVEKIDKYDLSFPVMFNGTHYEVYVRKRPYLDYFLEQVSKSFEVVVFTASQKVYADVLLDILDPEKKYIKYRLFRESCLLVQGNYIKDLTVLDRDLKKTILVDNSPHAYGYQINNGIPIESWFDDDSDTELIKLVGFLRSIQDVEDVRPIVREHFKTYQLVKGSLNGQSPPLTAPPF